MKKIRQAVMGDIGFARQAAARPTDQPPAHTPARPDRDDNTPPARRAEG